MWWIVKQVFCEENMSRLLANCHQTKLNRELDRSLSRQQRNSTTNALAFAIRWRDKISIRIPTDKVIRTELLTLKAPHKNCSVDILISYLYLSKKIRLDFSCESLPSRAFTWNIKSYFLWKTMKKYLWMSSAAVVIGALGVKNHPYRLTSIKSSKQIHIDKQSE